MYAGEEKLKLGLERLSKAGDDSDLLGVALIRLHGALEDRFRHALAATPELPEPEQKRVLNVTKVQWKELIEMMRLYRGLSAGDAELIQKMNRHRQSVAHGDRYRAGRTALEQYAKLVTSFFPGLELSIPQKAATPAAPRAAEHPQSIIQPSPRNPASKPARPRARAASQSPKSVAEIQPRKKATASESDSSSRPARKPINPALILMLGIILIIACVGLSSLIQQSIPANPPSAESTVSIPTLPALLAPQYRSTTDILNLRSEPGLSASIISTLPLGTQLELLNEERSQDGHVWARVRIGAQEGWVDSQYLR